MPFLKQFKIGKTNCFLIPCQEGYLLIDTGWPGQYKRLFYLLAQIKVDIRSVKYILITHHHYDHVGNLREIIKVSPARIIVYKEEVPYLESGATAPLRGTNLLGKFMAYLFTKLPQPKVSAFKLRAKDIIITKEIFPLQKIGINGIILHTPGHTSGSLSLILESGEAFIGDVIMNLPLMSFTPLFAENLTELWKSWNKILSYKIHTLYPAHGRSIPAKKFREFVHNFRLKKDS